jgi:hypothetical protein
MTSLYETDFYAWTQEQTTLLQQQTWNKIDVPHLIEEITNLGRRERQQLRNRLTALLGHLLKWQFQPSRRGNSWLATIREQRTRVRLILEENPSLRPYLPEALAVAYQLGRDLAVRQTGLDYETFPTDPTECPYPLGASAGQYLSARVPNLKWARIH